MKTENKILELTFNFSLDIIRLYKLLQDEREFVISKQLLRCATNIGANAEEGNAAQKKRFYYKNVYRLKASKRSQLVEVIR